MDIGSCIKEIRKEKGLTQVEVAKKAGMAVNSLRLYEAGKRSPNYEQLLKLCKALDVWLSDLLPEDFPVELNESSAISFERGWIESQAELREEGYDFSDSEMNLIKSFSKLNTEGQLKAVERIEELTQIPKYTQKETDEKPTETLSEDWEYTDTTKQEKPPEGKIKPNDGIIK